MASDRQEQVERNEEAFGERLPALMKTQQGKFALMKDGEIVDFFDTLADAATAATRLYPEGVFSVQEVVDYPIDLGFLSHALPQRTV